MNKLTNTTDPTGFFRMMQSVCRTRYASPDGVIRGRGKIEHGTKVGPGRRRLSADQLRAGSRLSRKATRNGLARPVGVVSKAYENIAKGSRA